MLSTAGQTNTLQEAELSAQRVSPFFMPAYLHSPETCLNIISQQIFGSMIPKIHLSTKEKAAMTL